jgi:uncharacterized protein (TIGR03382 family)
VLSETKTGGGPFTFTTAATLPEGIHKLKVEIADMAGNIVQTQEVTVTVKKGATPPPAPPGMTDPANPTGGDESGEITGGCSTSGSGGSLLLGLSLLGLVIRRRR